RAGLERAEKRGDGVDRLPHVEADAIAGPDAQAREAVAQPIRQGVEIAVSDRSLARLDDGRRLRLPARAGDEGILQGTHYATSGVWDRTRRSMRASIVG